MNDLEITLSNLSGFGLAGSEGMELNESLKLVKKPNFFSRIIRNLFGNRRLQKENIAQKALDFLNTHSKKINAERAKAIITRLKPHIHDPITVMKAGVLLSMFEYLRVDRSVSNETLEIRTQIKEFRQRLDNFEDRQGIASLYEQCMNRFKEVKDKFKEHEKALLQSIPDASFRDAFQQNFTFEQFCKKDVDAIAYEALREASNEINQQMAEFRKGLSDESALADSYKKCIDRFRSLCEEIPNSRKFLIDNMADEPFKQALKDELTLEGFARLDTEVSYHISFLDMTTTRFNTMRIAEATDIRLFPNQVKDLIKRINEARRVEIKSAKPIFTFRTITLLVDEKNNTISEEEMRSANMLTELIDPKPPILWKNRGSNYTLCVQGGVVPAVKGIKALTLSGAVDVGQVLQNFPDLVYLNILDITTRFDNQDVRSMCPKLECICGPDKGNTFAPTFAHLNLDPTPSEYIDFYQRLLNGTLPPLLAPDAEIKSNGKKYLVHRALLANCSHVFRKNKLLTQISVDSLDKVIEFAYTGTVTINSLDEALQTMDAAEELQIPKLMQIVGIHVQQYLLKGNNSTYQFKGLHAQKAIRIYFEKNMWRIPPSPARPLPFPMVESIPEIAPLSFSMDDAESKEFSDYTIQVGNVSFALHKAILARRSNHYFNHFNGGSSQGENFLERQGVAPEQQAMVFDYIYREKIPQLSGRDNVRDFLWIANHDEVPVLLDGLLNQMAEKLIDVEDPSEFDNDCLVAIISEYKEYVEECAKYSPERYRRVIVKLSNLGGAMIRCDKPIELMNEIRDLVRPAAIQRITPVAENFLYALSAYLAANDVFE